MNDKQTGSRLLTGVGLLMVFVLWWSQAGGGLGRWWVRMTFPGWWSVNKIWEAEQYIKRQRTLVLENQDLKIKYAALIDQCQKQGTVDSGGLVVDADKYDWVQGKITTLQGVSVIVEVNRLLPADEGVVILDNWLIGRWFKINDYQARVVLWWAKDGQERVEITDDKGNLIGDGVLRMNEGRLVVDKILRGVNLNGNEWVRLLSGRYTGMPVIGYLSEKIKEDSVYQVWSLKDMWQAQIRLGEEVYLVFNRK